MTSDHERTDEGQEADRAAGPRAPDRMQVGGTEVRLRYSRAGDEEQLVSLFEAGFGGFFATEKSLDGPDFIRWFTEPHDSHQAKIKLAEADSEIVSATGAVYRPMKVGRLLLHGAAGGIGATTLPTWRRKGLGRAHTRWSDSVLDPPRTANVATRRVRTRDPEGYNLPSIHRMGVYLFGQRPWQAARARGGSNSLLMAVPFTALALWGRARSTLGSRSASDVSVSTLSAFGEQFEPFLERVLPSWDVIPVRSVEYLNWRYCDPRAGEFTVRAAMAGGDLVGYVVVHALVARGHIVDLLALPGRLDVVRTLVVDALRQLHKAGAAAVECWMLRRQPYARVLRQAGFVRLPRRSDDVADEVGWEGSGIGLEEQALLTSPQTRVHLVRADFDAI